MSHPSRPVFPVVLVLCLLLLTACRARTVPAPCTLVAAMTGAAASLPAGVLYTSESSPGAPDYLSPSLLAALYGDEADALVSASVESAAVRLSSFLVPCEFAVFRCRSDAGAEAVGDLCLRRADTVCHLAAAASVTGAEDACAVCVRIVGHYVLMALCPEAERSVARAYALLT